MSAPAPYRSTVPAGGDHFGRLLLSEWTKLRTVPRWVIALAASAVLTVAVALLAAAGTVRETSHAPGTEGGAPPPAATDGVQDLGRFEHHTLSGDGSLVARVTEQEDSHDWAKAGLMLRESTEPGSWYAAVMLTPGHGVRLQSDFADVAGGDGPAAAPRWLKLTRSGDSVTAYESADGAAWNRVGTVEREGLPADVEIGLFVASPDAVEVERQFGGEIVNGNTTTGRAAFDGVRLTPGPWPGAATPTLTGSGDIGPYGFGEDPTRSTLNAVLVGLMAIVPLAVLFVTAEYRWGAIHTTLAVTPRRGRVLAAKAIVIGAACLAAGAVAGFGAFLLSAPVLRSNGVPTASLADGPVLRAVAGTAALVAVVAVLSLGVASILRRSAAAVAVVLLLLLVPRILGTGLPLSAAQWLERLTPAAGFAIQQTVPRYDTAIGPWAGFGVLCCYAAAALALALWLLRRRDA
ncbi:ABC transporter permease subunit [Streptomyces sp. 6N223]|uniref:ABC transporter permease subunit n=1 Tax=Streptomyces sp. 6N223 TaxID=3457412 RepID=UPI003FD0EB93